MKKNQYIAPETSVTHVDMMLMASNSGVIENGHQSGFGSTDDSDGNLGKGFDDDDYWD